MHSLGVLADRISLLSLDIGIPPFFLRDIHTRKILKLRAKHHSTSKLRGHVALTTSHRSNAGGHLAGLVDFIAAYRGVDPPRGAVVNRG